MIINAMKLALEALENASPAAWASRVDSDTMKSIWRKHADALKGLRVLLAELDNASCKSAQKRLEAQQPASKEHLFELWWEAHMPNATQEKAWTAFTAAVASNGVGIAAQQPATPEPVAIYRQLVEVAQRSCTPESLTAAMFVIDAVFESLDIISHPAPPVPDDVVRDAERYRWLMSWLQQMNLLKAEFGQMGKGEKPSDWWMLNAPYGIDKTRPFFGHGKTADAAIDAAMLAAKEGSK